jgi:tol-pal system protein YbgF
MMKLRAAGLLLVLLAAGLGACATKKDVDSIQTELASLASKQDAMEARLAELDNSVSLALERQGSLLVTVRGDLMRQLDDMERELVAIQELLGQSQVVLQGLRDRMEQRQQDRMAVGIVPVPDSAAAPEAEPAGDTGGDAAALYSAAIEQFRRGAFNTARSGFEDFLVTYPADELAPDAQYYLAETHREEGDLDLALREYNRVIELYPNSRAAPTALYKAGLLQEERGNRDSACQYFARVMAGYPRSDESRLAGDRAERLNCNQ